MKQVEFIKILWLELKKHLIFHLQSDLKGYRTINGCQVMWDGRRTKILKQWPVDLSMLMDLPKCSLAHSLSHTFYYSVAKHFSLDHGLHGLQYVATESLVYFCPTFRQERLWRAAFYKTFANGLLEKCFVSRHTSIQSILTIQRNINPSLLVIGLRLTRFESSCFSNKL